ncbi:MAG: hypothetical protein ACXIUQ_08325 [Cecembia sp.]
MKNHYLFLVLLFSLIYCNPKEQQEALTIDSKTRLILVSESDSIYLASFQDDLIVVKDAAKKEGTASIYLSEDSRLLFSMERTEGHINIMDLSSFGKWLPVPIERPQPTHWTGMNNHSLIFNDGDGSVVYIKADQSTTEGFTLGILEVEESVAHHGAALYLNNDAVAMTMMSEDEEGSLPKKVALVDIKSQQILLTTDDQSLGGIHGAQSNGVFAVFGSMDGILWVKNDQRYGLMPYPQPLENSSGNWIGTIKGGGDSFIGSSRNHGLFKIEPEKQKITSMFNSDQIADFQVSPDGKYTVVLLKDNQLVVLDNGSLNMLTQGTIPDQPEIPKGFKMIVQNDLLFVTALGYKHISVLDLQTLNLLKTVHGDVAISDFKIMVKN